MAKRKTLKERLSEAIKGRPNPPYPKSGYLASGRSYGIGPTTSGDEFQNSFVHEIRHLADAIAKSLGVPLDSERPAYISGDLAKALAEVVCELGCR